MMLDELAQRICSFDARVARFSTTMGVNLPATGAHMHTPAVDGPAQVDLPLRFPIRVQRLEQDTRRTFDRLVRTNGHHFTLEKSVR